MIYVTGDMHGDIERLYDPSFKKLKEGDTLIIAGDFGFLWDDQKKKRNCSNILAQENTPSAF